ncbi:hypothetical protein GQ53DRAFT_847002 [Thozetella sp. PMI_491]|nr:hypothetical protein GQ53DRAFT_847002 [Thozetella sp. PMI_491]
MTSTIRSKRKRSAIACMACHRRKVRCNLAAQGAPCSNCLEDGDTCRVYGEGILTIAAPDTAAATTAPPRVLLQQTADQLEYPATPSTATTTAPPRVLLRQTADQLVYPATPSTAASNSTVPATQHTDAQTSNCPDDADRNTPGTIPQPPGTSQQCQYLRTRIENILCDVHNNSGSNEASKSPVPHFAGDSQGMELFLDICYPSRPFPRNFYIIQRQRQYFPSAAAAHPLRTRSLPESSVCRELLRCYFHNIHPFLPVVHAGEFLTAFDKQPESISPLLLWSVFFAGATFIGPEHLCLAGFKTVKEFRNDIYRHVKLLYDMQVEIEKPTIIQACILLSYHLVDREDLDGPCYWIGAAISLAHTIGLHRNPSYDRLPSSPFSPSQCSVWKRLWWCCHYRDAWLALGFGRPMRINADDCDIPMPHPSEVLGDLNSLAPELQEAYIPHDLRSLVHMWINLLHLSLKLEAILAGNFRAKKKRLLPAAVESHHADLEKLYSKMHEGMVTEKTRIVLLHRCLLKCYHGAVMIALYRPFIRGTPDTLARGEEDPMRTRALERSRTAASKITRAINELVSSELLELSSSTLTTCINSAMVIHVFEARHTKGIARQHALHNISLHMLVLSHLGKIHFSAEMQYKFFSEVMKTAGPLPPDLGFFHERTDRMAGAESDRRHEYGDYEAAQSIVTPRSEQQTTRGYGAYESNTSSAADPFLFSSNRSVPIDLFMPFTLFNVDTASASENIDFIDSWNWGFGQDGV